MTGIKHSTQGVKTNDPASEISSEAWNKEHDPGETADVLTDHDKALHDALGVNAAELNAHTEAQVRDHAPKSHGNEAHDSTFITQSAIDSHTAAPDAHHAQAHTLASHSSKACSELDDHNKTVHDGLGLDAATLDGSTKAQVQDHAPKSHGNEVHSSTFVTVSAIAVDSNLSANAQDAVSKRHAQNTDTDLEATFEATLEKVANKGAVSGYAPLDANQKVPSVNLGGAGADGTKVLYGDQTWKIPAGGGESENIARATQDVTNATTTFADITGLTFEMVANGEYIFEAWLIFQSNTATTGLKVAANSAVAANDIVLLAQIPIALTINSSCVTVAARAYNTGTPSVSVDTINANLLCKIDGIVRNGASPGTFALRFAAETTGTVKIKTGSVLRYRKTY